MPPVAPVGVPARKIPPSPGPLSPANSSPDAATSATVRPQTRPAHAAVETQILSWLPAQRCSPEAHKSPPIPSRTDPPLSATVTPPPPRRVHDPCRRPHAPSFHPPLPSPPPL